MHDNNLIDRLTHHYTIMYLLFCAVTVVTEEYVGEPIYCWCPSYFTEFEVEYANYVCWVSNTYYLPLQKIIPPEYDSRATTEITYYQWVPLMFFFLALLCMFPRIVWKYLVNRSGVTVKSIIEEVYLAQNTYGEDRAKNLENLTLYIGSYCSLSRGPRSGFGHSYRESFAKRCSLGMGRNYGNYLVTVALFVKFLFFFNAAGQLFLINEFLGNKFYVFGFEAIDAYFSGRKLEISPRFPRVTLCDYDFRQISNVQRFTLQCVLPINYFNEAFFVIYWFWLLTLSSLTFINFLYSSFSIMLPTNKETFAKKYLYKAQAQLSSSTFSKLLYNFVHIYLKQDGMFLLKMISKHSKTFLVEEIVQCLWKDFMSRVRFRKPKYRTRGRIRHFSSLQPIPMENESEVPLLVQNGVLNSIEVRVGRTRGESAV